MKEKKEKKEKTEKQVKQKPSGLQRFKVGGENFEK
jgi:hypothetical protein